VTRRLPDPTTRRLVATIGGNARVRQAESPAAMTAPARAAFLARFERQVDPDGVLAPDVRAARVKAAMSEQMARVSLARTRAAGRRRAAPAASKPASSPPAAPTSPMEEKPATWAEFLAARQIAADS
jgi:hypothetical protein